MSSEDEQPPPSPPPPEWVKIQHKTFTRWTNEQLKERELHIETLPEGLKDGVVLVNLVEMLTEKPCPRRYSKKPKMRIHMIENLDMGVKMLVDDGIVLVNIGSNDIYDGNLKLILGLIWTLILHYQIKLSFITADDPSDGKPKVTAKQHVQNLVTEKLGQMKLPGDKKVNNFTTDWNDGIALCSLVESIAPGLCPEFAALDPANKLENAQLGLDRAELGLGVPKILEAEDLTHPEIDELSVVTYVSMLMKADKKIDIDPVDTSKIKIFGPEGEAVVNKPTCFSVDTAGAGFGRLGVEIVDSEGAPVEQELWKNGDVTKVQFTPRIPGIHKVVVTFNTQEVPQGRFDVKVLSPADSSKLALSGDGLNRAVVNKPASFTVDATNAGDGDLEVTVAGTGGSKIPVDVEREPTEPLRYTVTYTPEKVGPVLVSVKFAGTEVSGSPFSVDVVDDINPLKVQILGEGLGKGGEVGKEMSFDVCTEGAGNGNLQVSVVDENGDPLKVTIGDVDPENKRVSFTPRCPGNHRVSVQWSGLPVPDGEQDVPVSAPVNVLACVVGPVSNPIVGQRTEITVDCSKVGSNDLSVDVTDTENKPLEVMIADKGDGKFLASYTALKVDPLKVSVKVADQHAPGSVFQVHAIDPTKVNVNFDDSRVWKVGEPVEVDVGVGEAGPGNLGIQLSAPPGSGNDCAAKEVSPGNMKVSFTPTTEGEHVIALTFQEHPVPATPITIKVVPKSNPKAVECEGDGLKEGQLGQTARFHVDTSKAGPGNLDVKVRGPKNPVEADVVEVGDGKYEVIYTPSEEGQHIVAVKFADTHVPGSAFRPEITKGTSAGDVLAYGKGLEEGTPGSNSEFFVDTSRAGEGDLGVELLGPDGTPLEPSIEKLSPHHTKVVYPVGKEGNYTINITWCDIHIPKSPFNVSVKTPFNPSSVLATGPGLMHGIVGKISLFEVDCRSAGSGPLDINVEDDDHNLVPVKVREREPNNYDVSFVPQTAIPHFVHVKWSDFNIKGSPFKVTVMPRPEKDINLGGEGKIRVYYSTTTSSEKIRHNCRFLQSLLERKKVHLREDFEPWIPIDIGMDREERNRIFEKAGVRKTPMLFIDDQYVGDYDDVVELDETGELDRLLSYCALKYRNLQTVEEARKVDELLRMQQS